MENNEAKAFQYTYSSQEQEEVKNIRKKYMPQEEDALQRLRKLDMGGRTKHPSAPFLSALSAR